MPPSPRPDRDDRIARIDRAARALARSNAFVRYDPHAMEDAASGAGTARGRPLAGLAVSVKDLMDARGWPTCCGTRPPASPPTPATQDAPFVARWRRAGAWIVGKTHLNEHAYGLTGENPWWGDCTHPLDPTRLTGGSSSGAAATVLGGAADAGLGTDTGGSLRVPASLCGLASIRAPGWLGPHDGVRPLAPSFDALGWIGRRCGDLARMAAALLPGPVHAPLPTEVAVLDGPLLDACDSDVRATWQRLPRELAGAGVRVRREEGAWLSAATATFGPLQAREAWGIHGGRLAEDPDGLSAAVRSRLEWGRSIDDAQERSLRRDAAAFQRRMGSFLGPGVLLALPASAVTRLAAGADHGPARPRLLALTTPASVAGLPVVTQPCPWAPGASPLGIQWIAARGAEWTLLRWAEWLELEWARTGMGQAGHNETARGGGPRHAAGGDRGSWIS